jgi:hypothetical protein
VFSAKAGTTHARKEIGLSNQATINFDAPAVLRKRPSRDGKVASDVLWPNPYLIFDGTLGECLEEFLAKPVGQRHLYEIHTAPQADLVTSILSSAQITQIAL